MDVRVKFLGGAGTVTGSKYLLYLDDRLILVDCGLFQGLKSLRLLNWDEFPVEPSEISAVVLTHAHLDHSGYLPRLFRQGFKGTVYCTPGTADLLSLLLRDSAKLQEEEAEYARSKGYSSHSNPQPLYNSEDVEKVFPNVRPIRYRQELAIDERVTLKFYNAGHILGAAIAELTIHAPEQKKQLVFSGDLGRNNDAILYPPEKIKEADILFVESTYGDRESIDNDVYSEIADAVNRGLDRGGCLMIPAFAVGRSQTILYYLNELMRTGEIPIVPVYMDSPMAISATQIYMDNSQDHKIPTENILGDGGFLTLHNKLSIVRSHADSKALNTLNGPAIILSASGMMTGGRILHHLYHRLPRTEDSLLIVGFQPVGTRGRSILDGEENVRIFGENVSVKCRVEQIDGLSAHADRTELLQWLEGFESSPKQTFVVHGEPEASEALRLTIEHNMHWNAVCPAYLETVVLFEGI